MFQGSLHNWFMIEEFEDVEAATDKVYYKAPYIPFCNTRIRREREAQLSDHINKLYSGKDLSKLVDPIKKGIVHSGVLKEDVIINQRNNVIPMIECHSLHAAKLLHHESGFDCNFIFIQPQSI